MAKELTIQFEEYRDHEAVQKLNKLLDDGFVDTYDVILSLYNTNLPELKQLTQERSEVPDLKLFSYGIDFLVNNAG